MMSSLFYNARACFAFTLIIINTLIIGAIFYLLIPFKLILKGNHELILSRVFNFVGTRWISTNNLILDYISGVKYSADIPEKINDKGWYVVISNHQTWTDIFLLQKIFNKKAPFLKFFLKKELIWVPVIGGAWWALDFPFMKRFSKSYLEKNPHMKGKDMDTTKKACEKFKFKPVAVMNFPEGTRNRNGKSKKLGSPYENLIRPKAGGVSFVLEAMDGKIGSIIDVTIVYSKKSPSLMKFLSGRQGHIHIQAEIIDIEEWMVGNYIEDKTYRDKFQIFINEVWEKKNKKINEMSLNSDIQKYMDKSDISVKDLKN